MHRITSSELTTEHRHHKTIEEPDTSEKKEISTIVNEMQETIEINPYTNKPYSKNYYKILEKRMQLLYSTNRLKWNLKKCRLKLRRK